jgi:hypothetical protein
MSDILTDFGHRVAVASEELTALELVPWNYAS